MAVEVPITLRTFDPELNVKASAGSVLQSVRLAEVRTRNRSGGKPAAPRLRRQLKSFSKRAAFLRWFMDDPDGRSVGAAMATFQMTRPNVMAYWTALNRDHGIGYSLSGNTITVELPDRCDLEELFT
jgi:hypothetical protein